MKVKDNFLSQVSKTIKKNPTWAADTLLAVNIGVTEFATEAQKKINTAELFFKCLDTKSKLRLEKMGVKFTK